MDNVTPFTPPSLPAGVPAGVIAAQIDELAVPRAKMALCALRDMLGAIAPGMQCDPHGISALIDCIAETIPDNEPEDDDP